MNIGCLTVPKWIKILHTFAKSLKSKALLKTVIFA